MKIQIPGYTPNAIGWWFRDIDGTGPYGMDDTTSPPTPYLLGKGAIDQSNPGVSNAVALKAATTATSTALENGHALKAGAGTLRLASVFNTGASAQFYQLFDSAAAPVNGTVPVAVIAVAAGQQGRFDYGSGGRPFVNGIYIGNSTTAGTRTPGAADSLFDGLMA